MTLLHRSLVAIAISASLAGCYTDTEATVPMPENPEPLLPLDPKDISLQIGDSTIDAMEESVVITTLEGEEKRVNVETFKGIDYATQARFEHSEYAPLADEVDATEFGYACMQNRATAQTQDEDCLNLNIWRPAGADAGEDLPVYVFIHGGDFEYGSGSEALVHGDTVVAQGSDDGKPFIYVSLNYRLGLLGSHWVDGKTNPEGGNFGLGDQKNALKWINENIYHFGGDETNVTVVGQGAGAMSLGILQQDDNKAPIANKYFDKAIMQSNPYGFEYKGYSAAESIATTVCEELGLYDIETGDNTLKSTLNLVLAIVPDDVKEILEPIIEQMDDEVDTVVCATDSSDQIKNVDVSEILNLQKEVLANPIKNTLNWVVDSVLSINPLGDYKTPMSNFMPFAPYIESNGKLIGKIEGYHFASQPMKSDLSVQTVIGTNANETNSFGMLPSLTFLIPTILELVLEQQPDIADVDDPIVIASAMHEWLNDKHNQQYLINSLNTIDIEEASTQQSLTAYGAVTQLFFGLSNLSESGALLNLTDFYPNSEAALGGATANMKQFKTMLNDTVFDGPARHMATNSTKGTTLYRFDKKPSFNMWNYNTGEDGSLDILDLFKTIGCISGACNGSELPFMFNKAVRFDGSEIHPNTGEKALMNEMSRLWFSEELFTDYQYSDSADNVLVIEAEGFSETTTYDWDYVTNPGVDPKLRQGRLTGLEEQGLMPWQWYLN